MSRLFTLLALLLLMLLLVLVPTRPVISSVPVSMVLGFLLLAGYVFGKLGGYAHLPGITGYLVAGIVFGPSCMNILSVENVANLQLINSFALTLIALTAGGEVNLKQVFERLSSFCWITAGQVLITFFGVMGVMTLVLGFLPGSFPGDLTGRLVVASMFAVIALANSPSSAVAVIVESRARGRMTDLVLGITIIKDILVILAFAVMVSLGRGLLGAQAHAGQNLFVALAAEITGSVFLGLIIGLLIIFYMRRLGKELPIFVIAVAFLSYELSAMLHFHALLVCMTAGLTVNNLSDQGRVFIQAIERTSLPIYVVFFAITGAGLEFGGLFSYWQLVLALVAGRLLFTWLGTHSGAVLVREPPRVRDNLWMGFLAQAGVSIGLAVVVAERFEEWGGMFKIIVLASIAAFQLLGPVLFRFSLERAGEIPQKK